MNDLCLVMSCVLHYCNCGHQISPHPTVKNKRVEVDIKAYFWPSCYLPQLFNTICCRNLVFFFLKSSLLLLLEIYSSHRTNFADYLLNLNWAETISRNFADSLGNTPTSSPSSSLNLPCRSRFFFFLISGNSSTFVDFMQVLYYNFSEINRSFNMETACHFPEFPTTQNGETA